MHQPSDSESPKTYVGTWIAALLLLVTFVIGLLIFPPLYDAPKGEFSNMVLFIGRMHPILLHLPIGALMFLTILEFVCMGRRGESKYGDSAVMALLVGSGGSVVAVLAGIMLSREGGYVGGNFSLHQTMGIIGTAGVLLALVIRLMAMGQRSFDLLHAYRALFFLSFGIMSLGAHFGGNISHGSKFTSQFAPEPIKSRMIAMEKWMLSFVEKPKAAPEPDNVPEAKPEPKVEPTTATTPPTTPPVSPPNPPSPPAPASGDKLVFQHVILPIFTAKCNKCHSEEKSKGELRLDTFELTMKGGKESGDKNIVPGKPAESATIQAIVSDVEADEHMPPKGKDELTKEEIALIKWWVQEGASGTQKVADAKFPTELQATVDALLKP